MYKSSHREIPEYLNKEYTLGNEKDARAAIRFELENIRLQKITRSPKMIDIRKSIHVAERKAAKNKSTEEDNSSDTPVPEATDDTSEVLTPEEAIEVNKKASKELDLNGALQVVYDKANLSYLQKYDGNKSLKRRTVIEQLREAARKIGGSPSWELTASVFLYDNFNVDLFRISGGDRDFSHNEVMLYALTKIRSVAGEVGKIERPEVLSKHLDLAHEEVYGKYKVPENWLKVLRNFQKKDVVKSYAELLTYAVKLESAYKKINEIRSECASSIGDVQTITTHKSEFALVPETYRGTSGMIFREEIVKLTKEIQNRNRKLAQVSAELGRSISRINFLEYTIDSQQRQMAEVVGEYAAKEMVLTGWHEKRLEKSLQDHQDFVYQRNFIIEREVTLGKNGKKTRGKIIVRRRSAFPTISRALDIWKYNHDNKIRLLSNPDIRITVLQDIQFGIKKRIEGIQTKVDNFNAGVENRINSTISQVAGLFKRKIHAKTVEIVVPEVGNSEEDTRPNAPIVQPENNKIVPLINQSPVNGPSIIIKREVDDKILQLINLTELNPEKDKYLLLMVPPSEELSITMMRSLIGENLEEFQIPPDTYLEGLKRVSEMDRNNPDTLVNMFPWKLLSESTAIRLHLKLAAEGIETIPIIYPDGVLVGSVYFQLGQDYEVGADTLVRMGNDAQLIITNRLVNISERDKPAINIALSKIFTRKEICSGNAQIIVPSNIVAVEGKAIPIEDNVIIPQLQGSVNKLSL